MRANANARLALACIFEYRFFRLVIVAAEDDDTVQFRASADDGAQADDAAGNARVIDDAAVGNHGVVNLRAVDFRAGQIAWPRKNRRAHVKEIEARQFGNEIKVRVEKRADGANVFPVALENVGENTAR